MTATSHKERGLTAREFVGQIKRQPLITLEERDLTVLLEASEIIRADDTCLAGWIRILFLDGYSLVQEETPDGQILLRRLGSREAAEEFVEDRLATYERVGRVRLQGGLP